MLYSTISLSDVLQKTEKFIREKTIHLHLLSMISENVVVARKLP